MTKKHRCVILCRNPGSGRLTAVMTDSDRIDAEKIMEFESEDEAEEAAEKIPILKTWPYEIVRISL